MTEYEKYGFVVCLIVLLLLSSVFTAMIVTICRQNLRFIRNGLEDKQIKAEFEKKRGKKKIGWAGTLFSVLLYAVLFSVFTCSFALTLSETTDLFPCSVRVVKSGSMSNKNRKNVYLFKNELNNQIQTFDLILTYSMPDEYDLELYDIVVYKFESSFIIHRIVKIEEPNASHPDHRVFTLQGDNVAHPDAAPVYYSQMKGIYRNDRIPAIGSFVVFLQSPAGYLCLALLLISVIATPLIERKIEREKKLRFIIFLRNGQGGDFSNPDFTIKNRACLYLPSDRCFSRSGTYAEECGKQISKKPKRKRKRIRRVKK